MTTQCFKKGLEIHNVPQIGLNNLFTSKFVTEIDAYSISILLMHGKERKFHAQVRETWKNKHIES